MPANCYSVAIDVLFCFLPLIVSIKQQDERVHARVNHMRPLTFDDREVQDSDETHVTRIAPSVCPSHQHLMVKMMMLRPLMLMLQM